MERKENDLMMNMIANPDFSMSDFAVVGLNIDNTSIQSIDTYRSIPQVQEYFSDDNGQFQETKFKEAYQSALLGYNLMASDNFNKVMNEQAIYHRDNIFAPVEQRNTDPGFTRVEAPNPDGITSSIVKLGELGNRTKSVSEIAQSNQVLLNPTAVANGATPEWGNAPEDDFTGYFFDTLVLAQYDEDVLDYKGKVIHQKGSPKLNDDGYYYYEKLDGRQIYDKQVLNKMNVLTKEGTWLNQYDFFDSDDINQKSITGSVMKNLALVGTMFIPYVGPWIAATSLATQLVGVFGTFGKMLAGSDNKMLSELEGWSKSVSRQGAVSEYAQNHLWCWENFINLIGDVAGQLKEQRFIFEKVPTVFKGRYMGTKEAQSKYFDELVNYHQKLNKAKVSELYKIDKAKAVQSGKILNSERTISNLAQSDLDNFMKSYNRIGEILGKGYMTGIVVKDAYGEAINAGATDAEATMLTIGYAAAEYALLSSPLGKWIMPELQISKMRNAAIRNAMIQAKGLTKKVADKAGSIDKATKTEKKQYIRNLFKIGKEAAESVQHEFATTGKSMFKASAGSAMLEGFEELSEELLADFSKGCYNIVKWLRGEDTRIDSFGYSWTDGLRAWDGSSVFDRYTMALFGGAIGGGFANLKNNYRMGKSFSDMTPEKALQELIWIGRNEGFSQFRQELNKATVGDVHKSTQTVENNGVVAFAPGTKTDNQDLALKKAFNKQLDFIEQFLNAEGANISDNQFLSNQTKLLKDLRFDALHQSVVAGRFLQEFNSNLIKIGTLHDRINKLQQVAKDTNKNGSVEDLEERKGELYDIDKQNLSKAKKELSETQKRLQDLIEGKNADEFIAAALWDMSPVLKQATKWTFPEFVKRNYHKPYSQLTTEEQQKSLKEYKTFKLETSDELFERSFIYRDMAKNASSSIKESERIYNDKFEQFQKLNQLLESLYLGLDLAEIKGLETSEQIETAKDILSLDSIVKILNTLTPDKVTSINKEFDELKSNIEQDYNSRIDNIDKSLSEEEKNQLKSKLEENKQNDLKASKQNYNLQLVNNLYETINSLIDEFKSRQFVNPEIKKVLQRTGKFVVNKLQEFGDIFENQNNFELSDLYYNQSVNFINKLKELDSLNYSPIIQSLDSFLISIGETPVKLTELLQKLDKRLQDTKDDVSMFHIDNQNMLELENALELLNMYKIAILGARNDTADLNNLFGYNATLNEISRKLGKDSDLAEIDSKYADVLVQEIDVISDKLKFIRKLYYINQGYTLGKQDRVSVRKDILIYKQIRHIVDIPEDDELRKWNRFQDLSKIITEATKLKELSDNPKDINVNYELKKQVEKERLSIEDELYAFFQANSDKLDNPSELGKLLLKFDLYTNSNEILNEDLEELDGPSMVWYLAGRAAIKSSDFYGQLKEIIKDDQQLAMIATQEMAIFTNYAGIVNGNVFTKFVSAYKNAIKNDWKNKTVEQRKELLKKLGRDEQDVNLFSSDDYKNHVSLIINIPLFQNIILTEGIAGSGKTKSVYYFTIELLRKYNIEILSNVAVIHGSDTKDASNANDLQSELGVEGESYTPIGFLQKINPKYKPYTFNQGAYDIPKSEYELTSENEYITTLGISTDNPPSLIIIDEITKFNYFELSLINKYAKAHGITVIVAGDYDQTGISGKIEVNINGKGLNYNISSHRNSFIHSPKLGVSMRTDNTIKSENQTLLQGLLYHDDIKSLGFKYYEDETGLYGDKVKTSLNIDDTLSEIDKLIATLPPGKTNKAIGFIFPNANSKLYQRLNQAPEKEGDVDYRKYIDFKEGSSAQGNEAQYYIIEHNGDLSDIESRKELYTGITRATQGSLILIPGASVITSNPLSAKIDSSLGLESIKKYNKQRKQILNELLSSTTPIKYAQRNKQTTVSKTKTPKPGGLDSADDPTPPDTPPPSDPRTLPSDVSPANNPETPSASQDESDSLPFSINDNSDEQSDNNSSIDGQSEDPNEGLSESNDSESLPISVPTELSKITLGEDTDTPIINDVKSENEYKEQLIESNESEESSDSFSTDEKGNVIIDILLHSFNTYELGLVWNPVSQQYEDDPEWTMKRIDSANGLIKIDHILGKDERKTPEEYLEQIGRLRSIIFNTFDKSELEERIYRYLKLNKSDLGIPGINVKFAIKTSPVISQSTINNPNKEYVASKPNPFGKSKYENTYNHNSKGRRSSEVIPHQIVAVIQLRGGSDILEIPLLTLSSPFTLIYSRKGGEPGGSGNQEFVFPELAALVNTFRDDKGNYTEEKHIVLQKVLAQEQNYPQYKQLFNLIKLYLRGESGLVWIPDSNWTPAQSLENLGPQFSIKKGLNYDEDSGMITDYDGIDDSEWITLEELDSDPQLIVTEQIYTLKQSEYDGVVVGNAGHSCVLVSYDRDINDDQSIINQYINQLKDPNEPIKVKLMYILPPTATFEEYITHINNTLHGVEDNLHIGNVFTPFRILNVLYQSNEFKQLLENEIPGIVPKLDEALRELNSTTNTKKIKNILYSPTVWGKKTYTDDNGETKKTPPVKLVTLLGHILTSLCYKKLNPNNIFNGQTELELDQSIINKLSEILEKSGFKIYHKAQITKGVSQDIGPFTTVHQEDGWRIDGKPCRIHGKLDSYTFKGNVNELVELALANFSKDWKDQDKYVFVSNKQKVNNPSKQMQYYNKMKKKVSELIGKDVETLNEYDPQTENNDDIINSLSNLANTIKINTNRFALVFNGELLISEESKVFEDTYFEIIDIMNEANGKVMFKIKGINPATTETIEYTAEYYNGELSILIPNEQMQRSVLNVTSENFQEFSDLCKTYIIPTIESFDFDLAELLNSETFESFQQNLNSYDTMFDDEGNIRIEMLQKLLNTDIPNNIKQIIQELITYEESIDPNKDTTLEQSCPVPIKIRMS